jgi:trigger factor
MSSPEATKEIMQYEYKIEEISASRRNIHFTVEKVDVKNALDEAYDNLQKTIRLPGFRKGKVPRWLLEKRFSKGIQGEVANRLMNEGYTNVLTDESSISIVGEPEPQDVGEVTSSTDFAFTIGVDVKPEVQIDGYKGLEVVYPKVKVTAADVKNVIESRLSGKRKVSEVTKKTAKVEEGDFALVSLQLKSGEEVVIDEPGTMIQIGNHKFYTGVEEHIVGMKKGQNKDFDVTITDESAHEHLRGNTYQASVTLQQIQRYSTPSLTEEFAKEQGYDDIKDMKAKLKADLVSQKDEGLKNQARIEILQKLVESNDFDVPKGMVDEQLRALLEELQMQRMYAGEKPEQIRFSEEEVNSLRGRAVFAAKAACLLSSISKAEKLDVNDSDIDAKLTELANMRGQTIEAIKAYVEQEEGATEVLKERVQEEKTLNWLLSKAKRLDAPVVIETEETEEK